MSTSRAALVGVRRAGLALAGRAGLEGLGPEDADLRGGIESGGWWRERMGIEPTNPAVHEVRPALKTGRHTSTDPLPSEVTRGQVKQDPLGGATGAWESAATPSAS